MEGVSRWDLKKFNCNDLLTIYNKMKKNLLVSFALMLLAFSGWAQRHWWSCLTKGASALWATVIEKGTSNGVSTDFDGNFTIRVKMQSEVSFIGYIELSASATTNVTLSPGNELEEVIVTTGYSTIRRKSFTGSAKIVTSENIATKNVTNITQALAGRLLGCR